jgi:hypothetical protein
MAYTRQNKSPRAPAPRYPERGDVVVDRIVADDRPRKSGPMQAEEGLAYDRNISSSFVGGVSSDLNDRNVYETKMADGRGLYGRSDPPPTWAAVPYESLGAFVDATGALCCTPNDRPYPFAARAGANPAPLSPLDGLARGERPSTEYGRSTPPPQGGRGRVNIADVTLGVAQRAPRIETDGVFTRMIERNSDVLPQ